MHCRILTVGVFLVLIPACSTPRERVIQKVGALRHEWQTNVAFQSQLPEKALDWPTAVSLLRANNLKLRQARTEVTNAHESVRQVYRDLVPTLNLHAGISRRFVDVPSIGPNDVTLSADSVFNLPGIASFSARIYATRLYQLRAEAAYALAEREQIVELYRLFWTAEEVQTQSTYLQNQRRTAQAYEGVDPFAGQLLRTETEIRELTRQQESNSLQQRASDLLGTRQQRWLFTTNGLPELPYDVEPLPLTDTNRVAQLQIRLAAIELEAARAELAGIKLRYWPELNIFVTGPPLYQRSFGEEHFWDARDLRLTADAFWWIDTRGYISRQLRQTKRQRDLQQLRLRQESLGLMDRLISTQNLLKSTADKANELQQQLTVLEAVPPAQNMAALQKYAIDYQSTIDQLRQVRRDLAELKALFWFVDEYAWADIAPLKPLAAAQ